MTAKEWRERELAMRAHVADRETVLPRLQPGTEALRVGLSIEGFYVAGGSMTTDEGAKMLRDWLIEKFPITGPTQP